MRIILFLILTTLFSAPFWWFTRQGGHLLYINALMWAPALAAVITLKLTGGRLASLGWRGSNWTWILIGWAAVVGTMVVLALGATAAGLTSFPNVEFLEEQREKLHLPADLSPYAVFAWNAILVLTIGIVGTGAASLGEELGWRGFLTPETQRRWGFTASSLFVGLVWSAWHFPLMLGNVPPMVLVAFAVGAIAFSFTSGWLRLASGSVWPSVIMHAIHNALFGLFGRAFIFPPSGDAREIWIGEGGFALGIVATAVATGFWLNRKRATRLFEEHERAVDTANP